MIYTVTFNPSIDYFVSVNDFAIGKTNRTTKESMRPGGKGINVSAVLSSLGTDTTALGFTAGFTGNEIERLVKLSGIKYDFIHLDNGASRINIKLKNYDGTEINGMGPDIDDASIKQLFDKLSLLTQNDCIVLAGNIPSTLPKTIYCDICKALSSKNVRIVIDAEGSLLTETLKFRPFLIKPNVHELSEIFDTEITSKNDALPYMKQLKAMGAVNVLVSFGDKGAILLDENNCIHEASVPGGTLVNAVGSGDSMIAGFLSGCDNLDYSHAFKMAVAAGCATAYTEGLASKRDIESIYKCL